jgi:hypothetical protein
LPNRNYQKVVKKSKPFVLGSCVCGCGKEIGVRTTQGFLKRFEHHHNQKGEYPHMWNGGEYVTHNGYVVKLMPDHPDCNNDGYIYKHRWIMEQKIGRRILPSEDVHHIDGNKQNNSESNLELLSKSHHGYVSAKKDMSGRSCRVCKSTTTYISKKGYVCWRGNEVQGFICSKCDGLIRWRERRSTLHTQS